MHVDTGRVANEPLARILGCFLSREKWRADDTQENDDESAFSPTHVRDSMPKSISVLREVGIATCGPPAFDGFQRDGIRVNQALAPQDRDCAR